MKISSLELRNILSFGDQPQKIEFKDLNTIVGSNDSGKTNIFRTILFVNECLNNDSTDPDPFFHNGDLTKDFEIKLSVTLGELEIDILSNYIFCSILSSDNIVSSPENEEQSKLLLEKFAEEHSKKIASNLFKFMTIIVRRPEARNIYRGDCLIKLGKDNKELYLKSYNSITKNLTSRRGGKNLAQIILPLIREKSRDEVNDFLRGEAKQLPQFNFTTEEITDLFHKLDPVENDAVHEIKQVSVYEGRLREKNYPQAVLLRKFIREMGLEDRQVNVFTVISKIFTSLLVRTHDLRSKPQSFLSLENTIQSEFIDMKNLDGQKLPEVLFKLRNSKYVHMRKRYNEIQNAFKDICEGLEFDIGIKPIEVVLGKNARMTPISTLPRSGRVETVVKEEEERKSQEHELVIQFVRGDISIPLDHSAAGRFEILLLLTALIGQEGKIILLDEPAINLHPVLQRKILDLIENKISARSNQIIIITHSPYLINPLRIENVCRIASTNDGSIIVNVGKALSELDKKEQEKIIKNLQYSDVRSVFFSKGAILVEGLSDKLVIEQVDRFLTSKKMGASIAENDWYVLEMDGKDSMWSYLKMLRKLNLRFLAVADYDALMQCNHKINTEINTSVIPSSLYSSELLNEQDFNTIKQLIKNIKDSWYQHEAFADLDKIAKSHGIFVFTTDLEGALQTKVTKRESKPLKNLNVVLEKIAENKIPKELESMICFIKEQISK